MSTDTTTEPTTDTTTDTTTEPTTDTTTEPTTEPTTETVNISNAVPYVDICNSSSNKGKFTKTYKKRSVRCNVCRKKIGMLVFRCKCSSEFTFCSSHVQPEYHNCTFDHKSDALERLSSTLTKVVAEKIIRI
tara:strand:+ start:6694 stop:7089 length:396 start_codon:yes stop_codon:yes gene_type:complete